MKDISKVTLEPGRQKVNVLERQPTHQKVLLNVNGMALARKKIKFAVD